MKTTTTTTIVLPTSTRELTNERLVVRTLDDEFIRRGQASFLRQQRRQITADEQEFGLSIWFEEKLAL